MGKLKFINQMISYNKSEIFKKVSVSFIVVIGLLMCVIDTFKLNYELRDAFGGTIGSGLIYVWNAIAKVLGSSDYIIVPQYNGAAESCGLFMTVTAIVLTACVYFFISNKKLWPLWILVLPIVYLNLIHGLQLGVVSIAVLMTGILLAVLVIKIKNSVNFANITFIILVTLISASILGIPKIQNILNDSETVQNVRDYTADILHDIYYGENPLESGNLTLDTRPEIKGVALEITMSDPHSTYLRGFVGDIYKGDCWERLSNGTYYASKDLISQIENVGFNAMGQIGYARDLARLSENAKETQEHMKIKVVEADTSYAYIPYEIKNEIENSRSIGGSFVIPGKFKRLNEYSYYLGENPVKDWTETAAVIFTDEDVANRQETKQYMIAESHYNQYIYQNFKYISPDDRKLIGDFVGTAGDQTKGHLDYKETIENIKKYLEENFVYTESVEKIKHGESALESFFISGKGYDVHFATAAVMLFRYYGIPARYVEGYLVTPEDASMMQKNVAYELPRENAHAWAEIYIDGIGFVPIEVSPKYKNIMEEADMEIGISNESLVRNFAEEINDSAKENNLSSGDDDFHDMNIITIIFTIIAAVLLLLLAAVLVKMLALSIAELIKRRRLFMRSDPKRAISAIYGFMEEKNYPMLAESRALGNKAAYSIYPMEENDRKIMLGYLKKAKKEKHRNEYKNKYRKEKH